MPCSDEDSKDMPYLKAIFNFIESNPDQFDGVTALLPVLSDSADAEQGQATCRQTRAKEWCRLVDEYLGTEGLSL